MLPDRAWHGPGSLKRDCTDRSAWANTPQRPTWTGSGRAVQARARLARRLHGSHGLGLHLHRDNAAPRAAQQLERQQVARLRAGAPPLTFTLTQPQLYQNYCQTPLPDSHLPSPAHAAHRTGDLGGTAPSPWLSRTCEQAGPGGAAGQRARRTRGAAQGRACGAAAWCTRTRRSSRATSGA